MTLNNYEERIDNLLKNNMSEKSFKLWCGIKNILPKIFEMKASSTGKYHLTEDNRVQTCGEHVYEMLYAAIKIMRLFNIELKSTRSDCLLMAIVLHDSLKYGIYGNRKFTDTQHDKLAANVIQQNKDVFLKLFSEEEFNILEEAVRFHSGRWSSDKPLDKEFDFKNYNIETFFVHMLDMLSTNNLIKTDVRYNEHNSNQQNSDTRPSVLV